MQPGERARNQPYFSFTGVGDGKPACHRSISLFFYLFLFTRAWISLALEPFIPESLFLQRGGTLRLFLWRPHKGEEWDSQNLEPAWQLGFQRVLIVRLGWPREDDVSPHHLSDECWRGRYLASSSLK